ncbi:hypothetical protein TNCV_3887051 [Trichonephila clavipes]|nr:hypothetical protein TNCV_3887051 [Trichonephila clavipes]
MGSALETGGWQFIDQHGYMRRLNQVNLSGCHRSQAKGMLLQENASNLSSYKRRLERLAGILKFQELLKMYPVPVKVVKNEKWISHYGLRLTLKAVTHHAEAKKHKECESAAAMSHRMKSFFTPKGSDQSEKVGIAEFNRGFTHSDQATTFLMLLKMVPRKY